LKSFERYGTGFKLADDDDDDDDDGYLRPGEQPERRYNLDLPKGYKDVLS
jgi:hypothetical protein